MAPLAQEAMAERAKVFISYSRADGSTLAEELVKGLELGEFDAYLDKQDIEKGEDWEERLRALIVKADTVVFIISPSSVKSERCGWEVDRAVEMGKRIIPVQWMDVPQAGVPERLKRLNYIFFTPGKSFTGPLLELVKTLRQDLDWIRRHTLILEQAVRWQAKGEHADDLLLRGMELKDAEAWRETRKPDSPEITALQAEFLAASLVAEQQRRKRSRRTTSTLVALTAALAIGSLAWWQGHWLKEQYFWLAHVRGQVVQSPSASQPFKDCSLCPSMQVVPTGTFQMGSPAGVGEADERPQHPVSINRPLAAGQFEVTFEEWDACATYGDCTPVPDANGWGRERQPVINISWDDANTYAAWLSRMTGARYRLLTEAEWEYAARSGSQGLYCFGNNDEQFLAQYAWYAENADRRTHPVGQRKANAFKLFDMHGNVKEWVADCTSDNYQGASSDGSAQANGTCSRRVVRGGSWLNRARAVRSASREWMAADDRNVELGMRVVRELQP